MPRLNFRDITAGNAKDYKSDLFEYFAEDFFKKKGFNIIKLPARGTDGGADLIIIEPLIGKISSSENRWLVSCKHSVHSNRAIGKSLEQDVSDRLKKHNCNGFLGFYSLGMTESLREYLDTTLLKEGFIWTVYNYVRIEREIFEEPIDHNWLKTYFKHLPLESEYASPKKSYTSLNCSSCGSDFLITDKEAKLAAWGMGTHCNVFEYVCSDSCYGQLEHDVLVSNWDDEIHHWEKSLSQVLSPMGYKDFFNNFSDDGGMNKSSDPRAGQNIKLAMSSIHQYMINGC